MPDQNSTETPEPTLLPLDSWHRAHGARMVPFAGHSMPIQYEGILAEHLWVRESAGLFDVSHMGQLVVSGEGAATALERLLPAEITALADGQMRYSMLLNDEGGILDDLMLTKRADGYYLVVNGATRAEDIAYLQQRLPAEVVLTPMADQALLALQGPKAATVLARLLPGVEQMAFLTARFFDWQGTPFWVSRSGYTGEDGFEISLPASLAEAFATILAEQPEVKPAGLGARDSLRLEAGLPLYGHDLAPDITPVMAGIGFAIPKRRRAEGGFPGHAQLQAQWQEGPPQKRVGLLVDGRQPVREGATIVDADGQEIGRITSGGFSPTLNRPIAMGFVAPNLAEPGAVLAIQQRGRPFSATISKMPFVPHRYVRQKA